MQILAHIHLVIKALFFQEGVVGAAFDDAAVVDHQQLDGLANGAQAVGRSAIPALDPDLGSITIIF
jgi:hypothetical protein